MTLARFVEVFSTNPAKLIGLYPRKGAIAAGQRRRPRGLGSARRPTIALDDLHHESDYSPWEGWEVSGWPVATVLRGRLIVRDGELLGDTSTGQWLRRQIDPEVLRAPVIT